MGRANLLAVNKVFNPESEEMKAIVDSRDRKRIEPQKERIEEILQKLLKTPIEIAFS